MNNHLIKIANVFSDEARDTIKREVESKLNTAYWLVAVRAYAIGGSTDIAVEVDGRSFETELEATQAVLQILSYALVMSHA